MNSNSKKQVYLDNAASSVLDKQVLEAMLPYLIEFQGNPSAIHSHGRVLRAAIEKARKTIAGLLNASPAEIVFTSGGTESDNFAIKCTAKKGNIRQIISCPTEHHAVIYTIESVSNEMNIPVVWLQPDENGNIDYSELERALEKEPRSLISLMHGNNEIGTLHDLQRIADLSKHYGAIFHSDTVQTMGHFPYNTQELHVDFLVGSAHKFYGPKGIGFLYRRSGREVPPLIEGGSQERNQRAGTENVAGIVGMAKALELCYQNYHSYHQHLLDLKKHFFETLKKELEDIEINGNEDFENTLPTVLNLRLPYQGEDSMWLFHLDMAGISASGGSACTSGSNKGSHVLNAIHKSPKHIAHSIRFSFGIQNTIDEIDYTVQMIKKIYSQQLVK